MTQTTLRSATNGMKGTVPASICAHGHPNLDAAKLKFRARIIAGLARGWVHGTAT